MSSGREYSDDTAKMLDEEIAKILTDQEERAGPAHEAPARPRAHRRGAARTRDDRRPAVAKLIQQGLDEAGVNEQLDANVLR